MGQTTLQILITISATIAAIGMLAVSYIAILIKQEERGRGQ